MPGKRFSIGIDPIDSQELDLLECLVRVDSGTPLDLRAGDLLDRLIEVVWWIAQRRGRCP